MNALIVGATGGIGSALVTALKGSYALTLVGRDARKLQGLGGGATLVPTDVTSELEVEALFEDLPPQDLLIYAAGAIQPAPLSRTSAEAWARVVDTNLTGLFYTLKHAEPKLVTGARVYVLGARPELVNFRGFGAYAAAKAGVAALVKVAAAEWRRKAHLTLVLPKAVATDFWQSVGQPPKDALSPEDVAEAIVNSLQGEPQAELRVG
ncbi:SDR family NAD(P)-dependent oxidoreductase [Truepera radiovictrix]|uniref:Short-chain dehydrogenase/reductase SDR n=1 Tax=Truepera radiovictrix (strain DSM 17093 / CIP 108686 / LMG 22925 / RQ-24) TaxID=649638 RepID=D7CXX9_TRURR|nr:SDR family NAD(P)-dependent oxidoreductase [Truepera radiovictrix]ADI13339.1 short-chain dehydrogenase/reductase SDR [Truepera radiovictrix DSM 17093]WMT58096.1 SDR family NAD(P)-dependent oxidoreductase [Truepera radiovictrix]